MNAIPSYYHVLLAAAQASEAVDNFDLRSDDPQSDEEFQRLLRESLVAQKNLIRFILDHPNLINEL